MRFAVVGLGHIAQVAVLPAFAHARKSCALAALVSDEPKKLRTLGKKYGVKELRSYDDYDALLQEGAVDAVYIALPNDMHRDYTVRAADAGVHVLCEKPLATSARDAEEMVRAAAQNGVKLMTAYRLHFDPANMKAVDLLQAGKIGELRYFHSMFGMQVEDEDNIRLDARHGGGPLFDLGVYCVNAARYLFRAEPVEVAALHAAGKDARFAEVPESTTVLMRFPEERIASFTCSFGSAETSTYTVVGTKGTLELEPAYDYSVALAMRTKVGKRESRKQYPRRDQFAPELLHMAECILQGREPEPSGREGLADLRVIDAIQESAKHGKSVRLPPFEKRARPDSSQAKSVPPVRKPREVMAQGPSED